MLLLPTEETPGTLLTVTGLEQSPIYSCQKYLKLRDEARLGGVGVSSLKEKGREGRIQLLPWAAWQERSSQAPLGHTGKGQGGTGTRESLFTLRMIKPCTWHPKKLRNVH